MQLFFDEVSVNPADAESAACARVYKEHGCAAIMCAGGGSPIDMGKAAAALVTNGGHIRGYEGVDRILHPLPPLVMIPTTAGSGSEVSRFSVIVDSKRQKKFCMRYHWPGNMRELVNLLQRLAALYPEEPFATPEMLVQKMTETLFPKRMTATPQPSFDQKWRRFSGYIADLYTGNEAISLDERIQEMKGMEKRAAKRLFKKHSGKRPEAA
ncbi:iron-containing alcohol dehydrogenase [Domibacillus sp. PGB-M46]|uniref:iron-containing alcohol dehydrogenase n=1 Tax=Domibacillus sp. PGB-M46 TaxID=2910255 RepID=UPI001F57B825|nr:iron-containing alcohol dehydrogenase [Domibacillus sp. PGB-M46]MCI2253926.1 iron-containing alcohol dehydrogenase [Domibacillus sp. PGB-M46]